MTRQRSRRYHGQSSLVTALPVLMLLDFGIGTASAQQAAKPEGNPANETPAGQEFALRGQRAARDIKYSDWRKVCFKAPGTNVVCRTSISGTFETGQSAVRIGLIEREGDKVGSADDRRQLTGVIGMRGAVVLAWHQTFRRKDTHNFSPARKPLSARLDAGKRAGVAPVPSRFRDHPRP